MAKRFTDSDKWKKQFFKGLSTVNKLFFLYIIDECDNAGIWNVEIDVAEVRLGESIDAEGAIKELGKHLHVFDDGQKWFLPSFVQFQYGQLNPSVNAHKSVVAKLGHHNLTAVYEQFINCSSGDQDKDKDKDKDKDMDMDKGGCGGKTYTRDFVTFWEHYPKKKAKAAAWRAWKKHAGKPPIHTILGAIEAQRTSVDWLREEGRYIPSPAKWINDGCWEDEPVPAENMPETYRQPTEDELEFIDTL